ncbi:hypothetical protein RJT34_01949 [Clitoria ternatea]|uniref:Uncharacterized protein n=1 Tax=Clitoria ternatea TaxID=43366 RepID=A0AAN9Q038_CLITE
MAKSMAVFLVIDIHSFLILVELALFTGRKPSASFLILFSTISFLSHCFDHSIFHLEKQYPFVIAFF